MARGTHAILRNRKDVAAALCDGTLGVEEACNRYGLKLKDILDYLDASAARSRSSTPHFRSAMSRADALHILGVADGATQMQIRTAHRRLMMRNHPDHGGTDDLAARINAARDTLLG